MSAETNLEVREIAAAGYRTLRSIRFPVRRLSVFVGANGVGKTNLYRALQLIQAAAAGTLSRELAAEGGMASALWAGKRQAKKPARIRLMVGLGNDAAAVETSIARPGYSYEMSAGIIHSYAVTSGFACRRRRRSRSSRR
jgi:predicted ATPase